MQVAELTDSAVEGESVGSQSSLAIWREAVDDIEAYFDSSPTNERLPETHQRKVEFAFVMMIVRSSRNDLVTVTACDDQ